MKLEDAYYFKILLMSGLSDGYEEWLNEQLEAENCLRDPLLELSLCAGDVNKTISCLHNSCMGQKLDDRAVCDRLRLFLKKEYHRGSMSREEVVSRMHRFAANHSHADGFKMGEWSDMLYVGDCYSLYEDGLISRERFDSVFHAYLNDGLPVDGRKREALLEGNTDMEKNALLKSILKKSIFLVVLLTAFVVLLIVSGVLIRSCGMETRQDKVLNSLGAYDSKEFYSHGEFQDYTDFARYTLSSPELDENPYFSPLSPSDIPTICSFLDNFEDWLALIEENEPADEVVVHYDFDRTEMDTGDYFYICEDGDYPQFGCYDLWFFDSQTRVLYYFHNNI